MSWLVTIALPTDADAEDLHDQLWALGTTGIADVGPQTGASNHVDAAPLGTRSLIAGFETKQAAAAAAETLGLDAVVSPVDPDAWSVPEPQQLVVGGHDLQIEVGRAFGHGHHPTTRLMLDALVSRVQPGLSVLDVGTGTGILALAAKALSATPVVGIDIDPEAIEIAARNASANGLQIDMSVTPVSDLSDRFDLVIVNMLAAELAPLAGPVTNRLADDGFLVVAGFIAEQRDWVTTMFGSLSAIDFVEGDDGWCRLTFAAAKGTQQ